ncbi:MAG: hypothetical protein IJP92_00185 [Lachnospiraceae bacterium]|nr:hypothetical protein [Lachnospiraceae bacterium]
MEKKKGRNKSKRIQSILQIVVFLLLVMVLGGITAFRYADFRINDRQQEYHMNYSDEGSTLETDIATTFIGKQQMLDINGEIRKDLGQVSMNDVYKLKNGHMTEIYPAQPDDVMAAQADRVAAVQRYLASLGKPMIFVMAPFNISKYDPQLPEGVVDYTNDNADRFVAFLRERGVEVIDLRDTMHEDGVDHYDMFYRTDHHWNTKAGLYAYQKLLPWLEAHLDFETDPRIADPANYTYQTWPEWHLGTYGQRTSVEFSEGADDFSLFIPNFDTLIQEAGIDTPGRLEEAFYHMEYLQEKDYSSRLTYDNVLGAGDLYGKTCANLMATNNIKMLLVSNSFYRAIYPFLIMQFQTVRYAHTATVSGLTPDVTSQYDVMVMLYEPTVIWDGTGAFDFTGY